MPKILETFIGIEVNHSWLQISHYQKSYKEPETVSVIAGEQKYLIPTALWQNKSNDTWHYGEEAKRLQNSEEGIFVDGLLEKALAKEEISLCKRYQAEDLFFMLLKKIVKLIPMPTAPSKISKLTFTVETVTRPLVSLLERGAEALGIKKEALAIQDYKESFYYYSLSQPEEMWKNDIALFEYTKNYVICFTLHKDRRKNPGHVTVEEAYLGTLPENAQERDALFSGMIKKALDRKLYSAVYLIGDGFEGDWMKNSLIVLCRGRRVFQGKNLYTKGACYSGYYSIHEEEWKFSYFCAYKTKENILIKINNREQTSFYPMVKAGCNIHEINTHCEVLLGGEPAIELWIQKPDSSEATLKVLELVGLVKRPVRATRLKVKIFATATGDIMVSVADKGLGELFPSSGKTWEFEI